MKVQRYLRMNKIHKDCNTVASEYTSLVFQDANTSHGEAFL